MKVLVVAGYGATPVLRYAPETERYLIRVRKVLFDAHTAGSPFSHLILCGGRTQQKTSPGVSEAFAMAKRLNELDMELNGPEHPTSQLFANLQMVLEEDSFTSLENARNAGEDIRELWERFDEELSITVMCEGMRLLKWMILAQHFFPSPRKNTARVELSEGITVRRYQKAPIQYEIVNWELMPPRKELMATIWDACSISIPIIGPAMAWWWGWRRRQRAKHI